jgi:predicted enzyme related to lactoylglutathione lyase
MNLMSHQIDYIEFPATDLAATKSFYQTVFGWVFTDYGPDYTSFADGRIAGGFTKQTQVRGLGPLIVIKAEDLAAVQEKIKAAGGKIVKATFEFPGGKRFHFTDPSGNELSVWSEK